eukprot:3796960-Rhodomonas_salina.1
MQIESSIQRQSTVFALAGECWYKFSGSLHSTRTELLPHTKTRLSLQAHRRVTPARPPSQFPDPLWNTSETLQNGDRREKQLAVSRQPHSLLPKRALVERASCARPDLTSFHSGTGVYDH